jgi:hypothetical protein
MEEKCSRGVHQTTAEKANGKKSDGGIRHRAREQVLQPPSRARQKTHTTRNLPRLRYSWRERSGFLLHALFSPRQSAQLAILAESEDE